MPDWRAHLPALTAALALVLCVACYGETGHPSQSYVQSLRCGMSRAEVTQLAQRYGYDRSDQSWLARALHRRTKARELSLVDLTFRGGRLVAVREGRYDPRTRRTEYRHIELCGPPADRARQ